MNRQEWEKKCSQLRAHFLEQIKSAPSLTELEEIKTQSLGRKGALTELLKLLKDFQIDDKKVLGVLGNEVKDNLTSEMAARRNYFEHLQLSDALKKEKLDLTLPAYPFEKGRKHPLTLTFERLISISRKLGFAIAQGPIAEDEKHNFDDLNTPPHHPARAMQDTFYIADVSKLLRTHTSNVQIRTMRKRQPPIRIVSPGRVFRRDAVDASHSPVFHQIEGLYVDRNVSMADLKGTLTAFMKELFGQSARVRFRPSFFPFVEPGVEVDVFCVFCQGKGNCSVCKSTGWIELLGAGIVHPNVLRAVNLDPEIWSGFAFGMGIERTAMLLYGIPDIRAFYENDYRFLGQF